MEPDSPQRPGAQYATDRFGVPFGLLLVIFSLSAFVDESRLVRVLLGLLVVAVVLSTLRVTGTPPRRMRTAVVVAAPVVIAILGSGFTDRPGVQASFGIGAGAALAYGVFALIRRVFEHERVTVALVIAALAAYLQLALLFAFVYGGVIAATDGLFFAQGEVGSSSIVYFSVVTVTTLGYGDLTPITDVGRALAMIETLIGQIFIVVLVAYLVGSLGMQRTRIRDR